MMQPTDKKNIYDDAVAYDLTFGNKTGDLPFYISRIAECGRRVLELGCGTGRLTIPLALEGYTVTGIDIEESMLARAREKAEQKGAHVEWVHGDVRNFNLNKEYDVVFFPANSLSHLLDNESVDACLACVKKHLADEGRFIVQVFTPNMKVLTRDPDKCYPVFEYDDPNGKGRVIVTESNVYDNALQINNITWYYKFEESQEEVAKYLPIRIFFPQELDSLLRHNGFEIVTKYGDPDGSLFDSHSKLQIPVCRKVC